MILDWVVEFHKTDLLENSAVTAVQHGGGRVKRVGNTTGTADYVITETPGVRHNVYVSLRKPVVQ